MPRTGTLTQKLALEMLGLGPCYHMVNVLADLDQAALWEQALDGDAPWERIFAGFQSTVDWPGGYFYRELADAYPEAKVLLSVRDPQAWEESMRQTVWAVRHGESLDAPAVERSGACEPGLARVSGHDRRPALARARNIRLRRRAGGDDRGDARGTTSRSDERSPPAACSCGT